MPTDVRLGNPCAQDKLIRCTDDDFLALPKPRWLACHFRQLMPTVAVACGTLPLLWLRDRDPAINKLRFKPTRSNHCRDLGID